MLSHLITRRGEGLLQSYSLFQKCDEDCAFILKRLGLSESMVFTETLSSTSVPEQNASNSLKVDIRAADALLALCNYCDRMDNTSSSLALRANLYLFTKACQWYANPNVDLQRIILRMVESILKAASSQSKVLQSRALETLLDTILGWTLSMDSVEAVIDPAVIRARIQAALSGLSLCVSQITDGQKTILVERAIRFLDGTAFDIRILLADAPPDFGLEDVVKEHFKPTLTIFSILQSLEISGGDENCSRLGEIYEDYFKCLVAHLIKSVSCEPFLCSLIQALSTLYVHLGRIHEDAESVASVLLSAPYFECSANFAKIFKPIAASLVHVATKDPDEAYKFVGIVKGIVVSIPLPGQFVDYPNPECTMVEAGVVLGQLLSSLLPTDRVFCESFVSNFLGEIPIGNSSTVISEWTPSMNNAVVVMANIAISAKDDSLGKICLSHLMTQFVRLPPTNTVARQQIMTQFSIMASCCSSGVFNTVLDTFTNLLKTGASPLQTLNAVTFLSKLLSSDPIKRDVLLISLMRAFVDRGVSIISEDKPKKMESNFVDLDMLLRATCNCLESFSETDMSAKSTYIDIFQEFWMVLIVLGYQNELKWKPEWAGFIPVISRACPVLIKERDRLQSPGSTFSQVVLTQTINNSLRSHLMTLMPNCPGLVRNITFAQSLWLLAIFYCELNKLNAGILGHLGAYLKSDVVELLGLQQLVEDLVSTIIFQWKNNDSATDPLKIGLARRLMELLCHIQPRTHRAALTILRAHFLPDFVIYTDREIWDSIANKLGTMFFVCRSELGAPELDSVPEDLTRDPTAAQAAFIDLVEICRLVYGRAASETPNNYFKFAHSKIYSASHDAFSTGDRDIALLELLRIIFPGEKTEEKAEMYLSSETLLYRNAEDFVHYESPTIPVDSNIADKIVKMLIDFSRPTKVRKGIRSWLVSMDRNPTMSIRILTALTVTLPEKLRNLTCRSTSHPLCSKLSASPSLEIDRREETENIVSVSVLLDFLSEQLQFDAVKTADIIPIYFSLVRRLLETVTTSIPSAVAFRMFLFTYEVLDKRAHASNLTEIVEEVLYRKQSEYFAALPPFQQGPAACAKEELSIIKELLALYHEQCRQTRSTFAKQRHAQLAGAFLMILQQIYQESLIWLGIEADGKRKTYTVLDPMRTLIPYIGEYSLSLAKRLYEVAKLNEKSILAAVWRSNSNQLMDCPALISFTIEAGLRVDSKACIYSSPLLLPSAINAFHRPDFRGNPLFLNLAMRSLEQTRPDTLFFYIPQLVQTLRHDLFGFIEKSILHIAKQSSLFAHQIIWNMKANSYLDEAGTQEDPVKPLLDEIMRKIVEQFSGESESFFNREFAFFEKVTNISGALKPYVKREKWEKKVKIDEELCKIKVDPGVYLPSNAEYIVVDIDYDSGRPLQSHAKAPFMATFKVKPSTVALDGNSSASWQSAIFKVGDDCRQDVLALQLISLVKGLMEYHHLPVYLFPYRVVATAPGCGVIEVIPKSISRDQLGREKINSLYEYFIFRFGGESSRAFHDARVNFVRSMAAYSVVCYLLAIKDRHNGNIMIDDAGHVIHIDFGFILDIAPGGISFENAPFKLTSEMLQVMGGKEESPYFQWFRELCVQCFLVCRVYAESFVQLVEVMCESGLPCFRGEKTLRNLRNRFRLDLDAEKARDYMHDLVYKSCENVRTAMYDRYQLSTNGIPY